MKTTSIALVAAVLGLLALVSNADATVAPPRVPDATSSALLLSMALAGLASARAMFGKRR